MLFRSSVACVYSPVSLSHSWTTPPSPPKKCMTQQLTATLSFPNHPTFYFWFCLCQHKDFTTDIKSNEIPTNSIAFYSVIVCSLPCRKTCTTDEKWYWHFKVQTSWLWKTTSHYWCQTPGDRGTWRKGKLVVLCIMLNSQFVVTHYIPWWLLSRKQRQKEK